MSEKTSSMLKENVSKTMHKDKDGHLHTKKKTLNQAKPSENIRILRTFQGYALCEDKSIFQMKCKTMHMSNRVFSYYKKINLQREIVIIGWIFWVCLTRSKNMTSLFQGKIHIQRHQKKDTEYC